jgi:hypothetical protein
MTGQVWRCERERLEELPTSMLDLSACNVRLSAHGKAGLSRESEPPYRGIWIEGSGSRRQISQDTRDIAPIAGTTV